jgi:hypothetical protein
MKQKNLLLLTLWTLFFCTESLHTEGFAAGTLIFTQYDKKVIEELVVGDYVVTNNATKDKCESRKIIRQNTQRS